MSATAVGLKTLSIAVGTNKVTPNRLSPWEMAAATSHTLNHHTWPMATATVYTLPSLK